MTYVGKHSRFFNNRDRHRDRYNPQVYVGRHRKPLN